MEETNWNQYGTGTNPKCDDCMVHSGYEATAVDDTFKSPLKALSVFVKGPRTSGAMAPEVPFHYSEDSSVNKFSRIKIVESKSCSKSKVA